MKTKPSKKSASRQNRLLAILSKKKVWVTALVTILLVQSAAIYMLYIHASMVSIPLFGKNFWPAFGPDEFMKSLSSLEFKATIKDGINGTYFPMLASVPENRLYIPEARVSVPLTAEARQVVYAFYDSEEAGTTGDVVALNTIRNIAGISNAYSIRAIPCAQKLGYLAFNTETADLPSAAELLHSQPLADGRTMYVYAAQFSECSPLDQNAPEQLTELFKQAQSY